ncbi:unnamed protein product [Pylaiella littoralis]
MPPTFFPGDFLTPFSRVRPWHLGHKFDMTGRHTKHFEGGAASFLFARYLRSPLPPPGAIRVEYVGRRTIPSSKHEKVSAETLGVGHGGFAAFVLLCCKCGSVWRCARD